MRPLAMLALGSCLLSGCNGGKDTDSAVDTGDPPIDRDGDGYSDDLDCDDSDASIHPGVDEACDGIDNDCDGFVDDEDADLVDGDIWFVDADIDGYGDTDSAINACEQPDGYMDIGGDCDDSDATINPDKLEDCDGIDNDCDGEVDEDGATWSEPWYADGDGDGFGDPDDMREACEQPSGWVEDDTDCDDDDDDVYPGAPELQDGEDTDCDGFVNEFGPDDAWAVLEGESASDRAGRSLSGAGDQDGDRLEDLWVGARGDDDAGSSGGAVYLVTGDDAGQRSLANSAVKLTGLSGSWAGQSLDGGMDVDGDGTPDLVVGAPYDDQGERNAGAAWLVRGPFEDGSLSEHGVALTGTNDSDYAGWSVALVGDVDGDGVGEVLVGAPYAKYEATTPGVAYLVPGDVDGNVALEDASWALRGQSNSDGVGARVSAGGDLDGDGLADVLVGANGVNVVGADSGAAYVVYASDLGTGGSLDLTTLAYRHHGESNGDHAGYGLAGGGDVDGDGLDDVLVGAPYEDEAGNNAGAAYLLLGPAASVGTLANATAKLLGAQEGDSAGHAVAFADDVDGDGVSDVLVGAPVYDDDEAPGLAGLWLDNLEGTLSLAEADWLFQGGHVGDYVGYALAGPGDMDGDGLGDLLLGSSLNDGAGTEAGAAYVVVGIF